MKMLRNLFMLVGCMLLFSCNQPSESNELNEAATTQINERNKQWMAAIESGDPAAIGALYTENAVLMPPNMPSLVGREAVQGFMTGVKETGVNKIKVETSELEVNGSRAIESGKYQIMVQGEQVVDEGKYMIEWRNEGGNWYMHRDIFNSDMAAPRNVAHAGQDVWVVVHHIKADRRKDFENFVRNTLVPAVDQTKQGNSMAVKHTRFLIPDKPSADGSYRYMFFMDPVVEGVDYTIDKLIIEKHGEEKGRAIMNDLESMIAAPFISLEAKQSEI